MKNIYHSVRNTGFYVFVFYIKVKKPQRYCDFCDQTTKMYLSSLSALNTKVQITMCEKKAASLMLKKVQKH